MSTLLSHSLKSDRFDIILDRFLTLCETSLLTLAIFYTVRSRAQLAVLIFGRLLM